MSNAPCLIVNHVPCDREMGIHVFVAYISTANQIPTVAAQISIFAGETSTFTGKTSSFSRVNLHFFPGDPRRRALDPSGSTVSSMGTPWLPDSITISLGRVRSYGSTMFRDTQASCFFEYICPVVSQGYPPLRYPSYRVIS